MYICSDKVDLEVDSRLSSFLCVLWVCTCKTSQYLRSKYHNNYQLISSDCPFSKGLGDCNRFVLSLGAQKVHEKLDSNNNSLSLDSFLFARQYPCKYSDVHFQYNLMMQALLVWAVGLIKNKDYLKGAFVFSVLLNFKHIYLYCAPAFFIYLLKEYVFGKE